MYNDIERSYKLRSQCLSNIKDCLSKVNIFKKMYKVKYNMFNTNKDYYHHYLYFCCSPCCIFAINLFLKNALRLFHTRVTTLQVNLLAKLLWCNEQTHDVTLSS